MLRVHTAGLAPDYVPYLDGWQLQRDTHSAVLAGGPDTLILLEHEPVYTAGARTASHERPDDGTPVVDVDRGGKITWHGPGQLVGYPITKLAAPVDVVDYVRRLERVLIAALREFDVAGQQVDGRSGVWVNRGLAAEKVAAIGVRVQRGVTMHGFAVNCNNSLAAFRRIVPCGISDAGVTTISEVTPQDVSPRDILDAIVREFQAEYAEVAA